MKPSTYIVRAAVDAPLAALAAFRDTQVPAAWRPGVRLAYSALTGLWTAAASTPEYGGDDAEAGFGWTAFAPESGEGFAPAAGSASGASLSPAASLGLGLAVGALTWAAYPWAMRVQHRIDDRLRSWGVRSPELASAAATVAVSAGAALLDDVVSRRLDGGAAEGGLSAEEIRDEIPGELTAEALPAGLASVVAGILDDSRNLFGPAAALREQLAGASFSAYPDESVWIEDLRAGRTPDFAGAATTAVEVRCADDAARVVPFEQTYPVRALVEVDGGRVCEVSLVIGEGRIQAVSLFSADADEVTVPERGHADFSACEWLPTRPGEIIADASVGFTSDYDLV